MIEAGVRDSSASMVLARNWTLFYRSLESDFMSVPISSQNGELRTGQPQKKFGWAPAWAPYYDLASDGTRGVAAVNLDGGSAPPALSIVQNWHREFEHRMRREPPEQ